MPSNPTAAAVVRPLTALLALGVLATSGCQTYRRQALDLAAHDTAFRGRLVGDDARQPHQRQSDGAGPGAFDPRDGLALAEGELVALFYNPGLRVARLKARVPAVGAAEAGRWEDPEFGVDAERIVESVEDPWVLAGTLRLTVPISGRLGLEKDKALAEADVERARVAAAEQRVLADVRAAWFEWSAAVERLALARRLAGELDAFVATADRLRAAGEIDPLDARLFRVRRATHAGRLLAGGADARSAELRLRALLGLSPDAPVAFVPSFDGPEAVTDPSVPPDAPDLRVARAEHEVAERALRLEVRKQYPDLSIGGGFGTDEGEDRVLFGASLPIPLWNMNRRAIAEARAARDAARAGAEAEYERLVGEAAEARAALEAAAARLEQVERDLVPLADEQLAEGRRLGRLGDADALVLLEAVTTAYDAKAEVVDARRAVAVAGARLNALVGVRANGAAATTQTMAEEEQ